MWEGARLCLFSIYTFPRWFYTLTGSKCQPYTVEPQLYLYLQSWWLLWALDSYIWLPTWASHYASQTYLKQNSWFPHSPRIYSSPAFSHPFRCSGKTLGRSHFWFYSLSSFTLTLNASTQPISSTYKTASCLTFHHHHHHHCYCYHLVQAASIPHLGSFNGPDCTSLLYSCPAPMTHDPHTGPIKQQGFNLQIINQMTTFNQRLCYTEVKAKFHDHKA